MPGGDAELASERVERIAAEEPQDDLGLAAVGPTASCPSGRLRRLRARFAAEGVVCRGFFMVSCIVPSSPKRVSQETVQRTRTAVVGDFRHAGGGAVPARPVAALLKPPADPARAGQCNPGGLRHDVPGAASAPARPGLATAATTHELS